MCAAEAFRGRTVLVTFAKTKVTCRGSATRKYARPKGAQNHYCPMASRAMPSRRSCTAFNAAFEASLPISGGRR